MIRDAVIHLLSEQPVIADLFEMPSPGDVTLLCTNLRTKDGKRPVFDTLAPKDVFAHLGGPGAGHYAKMVHNAIEYGMMAAYAEGFNLLQHAGAGRQGRTTDAETTPLRQPEHYRYDMNLPDIAEVWRRGSVVGSWLLDLSAMALLEDPDVLDALAAAYAETGRFDEAVATARKALQQATQDNKRTLAEGEEMDVKMKTGNEPRTMAPAAASDQSSREEIEALYGKAYG